MKYRKLTADSDTTFCSGKTAFLVNTPEAVAQLVLTRLRLLVGEWFLNTAEGTRYFPDVLGTNTQATRDKAIRDRIVSTDGVRGLVSYQSEFNSRTRKFTVQAVIATIYGNAPVILQ